VVVTARTQPRLEEVAGEIEALGVRALAVPADVSREEDVERLAEEVLGTFRRVDILVNNVGVAKCGPLDSLSTQDYDWMMNTNMRSSFLCTRAFLPGMLAQEEGWIVFLASVSGLKGLPGETVYCASKFAQVGFAQALDYEVRERGVKVSVIAPGGIRTELALGMGRPPEDPRLERFLEPEDVAEAVVFALTQPPKSRVFLIGMRPMSEPL
jgi:NADP-dependent 3-hydroxy acid dehydrogenase YdfG